MTTLITCAGCGTEVVKPTGEVNRARRLGRGLYCTRSCVAKTANAPRTAPTVEKDCPCCGKPFLTTTKAKARKHCSPECASRASVTDYRRLKQSLSGRQHQENLLPTSETLARREAYKYAALRALLEAENVDYQFEYPLDGFVFDLYLPGAATLVEFDGPYHDYLCQKTSDWEKEDAARNAGFHLIRLSTSANAEIEIGVLTAAIDLSILPRKR